VLQFTCIFFVMFSSYFFLQQSRCPHVDFVYYLSSLCPTPMTYVAGAATRAQLSYGSYSLIQVGRRAGESPGPLRQDGVMYGAHRCWCHDVAPPTTIDIWRQRRVWYTTLLACEFIILHMNSRKYASEARNVYKIFASPVCWHFRAAMTLKFF